MKDKLIQDGEWLPFKQERKKKLTLVRYHLVDGRWVPVKKKRKKPKKIKYEWIVHHSGGQEGSEEAHRYLFKDHAKAQEWLDYKVKYYSTKWRMIKVIVKVVA